MELVNYCELAKKDIERKPTTRHQHPSESSFCLGYLTGVGDAKELCLPEISESWPLSCVDNCTTMWDAALAFVDWAHRHPEKMRETAALCAAEALAEAYPSCRVRTKTEP
jgi:hypothetical protein